MNAIFALIKKELRMYFNSPLAYVFIVVFLAITHWLFFRDFFLFNQSSMRGYFYLLPWVFLFLIPAITMRLWAEEKRSGTIEVLLTFPVQDYQVVIGKFLASVIFLAITLLCSLTLPFTVAMIGDPDLGVIFVSYLGALLLGAAYLAIGLFISSLCMNQIVAFIMSIAACFLLFIVGELMVTLTLPDFLVPLFRYLGLGTHYESIIRGVIDSRDLIYYFLIIGFFLFLNIRSLESRKWK